MPGQGQHVVNSSSAAVLVDQPAQHVDPLHGRLVSVRLDKRQPAGRTRRPQIQAPGGDVGGA